MLFDDEGKVNAAAIPSNGGEWKHETGTGTDVFVGYSGENIIHVIQSPMQSGHTHVVVVHQQVDSPSDLEHHTGPYAEATAWLNKHVTDIMTKHA